MDNSPDARHRFAFGRNWQDLLPKIDESRIARAERSLREMLRVDDLNGRTFLDVGSGSGLFSLAAKRLGASKVHSFDYDLDSVRCTQELKKRFYGEDDSWTVERGDILDRSYLSSLGEFDVVYSWGVLHATGDMWQAIENIKIPLADDGKLFIAMYNDQGFLTKYWTPIKYAYNAFPFLRPLIIALHAPYLVGVRFLVRLLTGRLQLERGMNLWIDMKDWLGGWPFDVAHPDDVINHHVERGFTVTTVKTVGKRQGPNEFVFTRADTSSSSLPARTASASRA